MTNPAAAAEPGPPILEQLNHAWREKRWTVAELAERSGLGLERTTMGKKMAGSIPLKDTEIQALAICLGVTVVYPAPAADTSPSVDGAA